MASYDDDDDDDYDSDFEDPQNVTALWQQQQQQQAGYDASEGRGQQKVDEYDEDLTEDV